MKTVLWIVLGLAVLAIAAFAAFWFWGSAAFTPPRVETNVIAQGAFEDGLTYQIARTGPPANALQYQVTFGTEDVGLRYLALSVDDGGPRPIAVTHAAPDQLDVAFDRALADGAASLAMPVEDLMPAEIIAINADGAVTRTRAPWLGAPGEAPL